MTLSVNEYNRIWKRGVSISYDLKQLVIQFLLDNGANPTTSSIPRGLLPLCTRTYKIAKPTVYCLWKRYCFTGQLDTPVRINQNKRLLSEEDHQFIKQLVLLDLTIYKTEIRDKIYQYSNSPPPSISISTVSRTVRHRLGILKWTRKRVQRSCKDRWNHCNILYTRNFMDHVSSFNPYHVRFVDECSFNVNSGTRYYGSAEVGSRALHISKHNVGPNYTLFLMLGLNNKLFAYVSEGASDSNTYIEFVHQAVNSYNINGEPVLYPGCCIVTDRAPIHGQRALLVLEPYLNERDIQHFFLPSYSPCLNPVEEFFSIVKGLMHTREFQTMLQYYVPTAIYKSVSHVPPNIVYKLFRNVSCNYMNL